MEKGGDEKGAAGLEILQGPRSGSVSLRLRTSAPAPLVPGRASELCVPGAEGPGALSGPELYRGSQSSRSLRLGTVALPPGPSGVGSVALWSKALSAVRQPWVQVLAFPLGVWMS